MSTRLERVRVIVASHLGSIQDQFIPGAQVLVVVRIPGNNDADFTLGDMTLEEGVELLQRRLSDPTTQVQEPEPKPRRNRRRS